jgi:hypothetical protein
MLSLVKGLRIGLISLCTPHKIAKKEKRREIFKEVQFVLAKTIHKIRS